MDIGVASSLLAGRRPVEMPMLIGGAEVSTSERIEVFNPARPAELVGSVPRATPRHVRAAIAAAKAAQVAWGARSFAERTKVLAAALERLQEGIEERAELLVRENGKLLAEARGELAAVPARQKLSFELAPDLDRGKALEDPNGQTFVSYRPYGVVVSIVPWNAPISLGFGQLMAALLAGNGVVVKPPETCPLTLTDSIRLLAKGLPGGLVNIVTGFPGEIGDALTGDADVAKVAFTGSIAAGRRIMASAAQTIKSLTLELGGNDPAIVLPGAELSDAAVARMARAVFRMSGQICMAIKRIYVPEELAERFLAQFTAAVEATVVGNGLEPQVTMGPMHTRQAFERAEALVQEAADSGATVRRFGRLDAGAEGQGGHFMLPAVVSGIGDRSRLMEEEQFCPAVPVTTYRDVDEAIERANRSIFALGASVWGGDPARAAETARRLQAGTLFVNTHGTEAINRRAPYGGMKQSGIGRKSGIEGILEYVEAQTLTTFAA